ncbi:MAG: bifunctional [glutamate--ammonia ligase]-adenylyl-L-tyrosine phosphorylase/[glutamate--ammonia-ligase] adenylyltransferase [Endozoicomonas sp.]
MVFSETLPAFLTASLQAYWQQFLDACEENYLGSRVPELNDEFLKQLGKTWAGSDFAAQQCLRQPDLVFALHDQPRSLHQSMPHLHDKHLSELVGNAENEDELMRELRVYRNREMVRIIWRDLNRLATLEETTADLSAMADACVDKSLTWLYRDSCKNLGTPMGVLDNHNGTASQQCLPQQLVVLGMGKLGANELNLSSDIDLMFTYPCKGETEGGRRALDNQVFFIRLGQRLIKVLDSKTADGFVFRVDMRLRPYGNSGALAMSFSAMEQYYQDQGRDWERYAMIKARAIAGDISEGERLLETLKPFTFRKYIDFGAISALRDMKLLIQREVKRKGMENNIKLGPGGIREIEFIVQSFQLIHGGRDRSLQNKALLNVLETLKKSGYLPAAVTSELREAYIYLRNLEHAIQAVDDKQTQQLPSDSEPLERLAISMGHENNAELLDTLNRHRDTVIEHFDQVITDTEEVEPKEAAPENWHSFWEGQLSSEEEIELFQRKGFRQHDSRDRLITLRDGKAFNRVRRQSRDRVDTFMPVLLEKIAQTGEPDICLIRLLPLVESVLRRTAYLVLLIENPAALEHLCKLCTASPWIAEQIARHPALLDEFLNIGDLYTPPNREELTDDLRQQLAHIPEDDLETQMEALRHFKMAHVLRVAAAQVTGSLPLMKKSDYLTWIAEVLLEQVVDIAWRTLTERHGRPVQTDGAPCNPGFIVIGYGKLGGIELGPGSDLDLVFVHNGANNKETDGPRPLDSNSFFTRLGQRIIHILSTHTTSGRLYEADMRLRPSGASGLLVSSFSSFAKYQHNDAWTWEHQALVRARAVAGDKALITSFESLRKQILCQPRDILKLCENVISMRKKMRDHLGSKKNDEQGNPLFHLKHDKGGIVDIEFMMQYAVLAHAHKHPEITEYPDNIRISESLESVGLLNPDQGYQLRQAYKFLRKATHSRAFQNERSFVRYELVEPFRTQVMDLWSQCLGDGEKES